MPQYDAYLRVSRVAGRSGESFLSPDLQRERIERWARDAGAEIVHWGTELDRSGGRMRRPELDRIIDRIRRGETEGVVVADRSRFARTLPGALLAIQDIRDAGGAFISSDGFDSSSPEGALFLHQMMAFAQFELDRIRQTWATVASRAVADGVYVAPTPYGYVKPGRRKVLEVDPERGALVAEAFHQRAAGRPWSEVAEMLGVSRSGAVGIITNEAYLGIAKGPNGERRRGAHAPLIDEATWHRAQPGEVLNVRDGSTAPGALLRGLVHCATCGYRMLVVSRPGNKMPSYVCMNKAKRKCEAPGAVTVTKLDQYVSHEVDLAIADARHPAHPWVGAVLAGGEEYDRARDALDQAQAELATYVERAAALSLGDLFEQGVKARQEAVAIARRRLGELRAPTRQWWETLESRLMDASEFDLRDRQDLLRRLIREVRVSKADPARRRWQPLEERVEMRWRGDPGADRHGRGVARMQAHPYALIRLRRE
jgi:site-specific DNA recombinase